MADGVGSDCKMYIIDGGNEIEVTRVRDNEMACSASEVDATSRANLGWRNKRAGLKEWGDSFDMVNDSADTAYQRLRTAFANNTVVVVKILDKTSGEGLQGDAYVTEFARSEPLDDIVTRKVTLVGAGKPTWIGME